MYLHSPYCWAFRLLMYIFWKLFRWMQYTQGQSSHCQEALNKMSLPFCGSISWKPLALLGQGEGIMSYGSPGRGRTLNGGLQRELQWWRDMAFLVAERRAEGRQRRNTPTSLSSHLQSVARNWPNPAKSQLARSPKNQSTQLGLQDTEHGGK